MSGSSSNAALILIDLQNEFLHSSGSFPILRTSQELLLSRLNGLVNTFRENGGLVIWVKSIYDAPDPVAAKEKKPKSFEDRTAFLLSSTHTGPNPCCIEGSFGAEFFAPIQDDLINYQQDQILIKYNYSAFKDTSLLDILQSHGATELYFGGLLSGTCVLASMLDVAQSPGFRLYAVGDCLGYRKDESHQKAVGKMEGAGVMLVESTQVLMTPGPADAPLAIPKLYYVNGSIPSWRVQMALYEKDIQCHQIRMHVMSTPKPTRMPFFLLLNHRGKTPVFIDSDPDKTTTNESLAILFYLETYYSSTPTPTSIYTSLLPPLSHRKSHARVLSLVQETENLHYAYDALEDGFFEAKAKAEVGDDSEMDHFIRNIRPNLLDAVYHELDFWEVYTSPLSGTTMVRYIAATGDITLADCAFYPILGYMVRRGFDFGTGIDSVTGSVSGSESRNQPRYENLKKYFDLVSCRSSAKLAQPEGWTMGKCGQTNVFFGR